MLLLPAMSGLYLAITELDELGSRTVNEDTVSRTIGLEPRPYHICLRCIGLLL